jgi:GTP-dependent phosphoenolpyruvate carboxykinase
LPAALDFATLAARPAVPRIAPEKSNPDTIMPLSDTLHARLHTLFGHHQQLHAWIAEIAALVEPDDIHLCDGSEAEDQRMRQLIVDSGAAVWLDPEKRPNSILVRSDRRDVARVEQRTFICSLSEKDAGPTNNW